MFLLQLFYNKFYAERVNPVYPSRTQTVHLRRTIGKIREAGQQFFCRRLSANNQSLRGLEEISL